MKNKGLWFSVAIFAVLAVTFSFTDWQISQALYNPEAAWAHFMEAYGQLPGSFLGLLSGSILIRTYVVEKKFKSIAGVIGLYLLTILAAFGFSADLLGAQVNPDGLNVPALLILTIALPVIGQVVLRRFSLEAVSQYKSAAKAGLALMILGGIVTVWFFKIPWGRWTYRDILEAGNNALFTPWYLPQGNNGHHSFFSGHTALSFTVLGYLLFLKKETNGRNILLAVLVFWGVLGGMSRIVAGAHFASDVLFGAGETLLWYWVLSAFFAQGSLPRAIESK
jgi:membrane-associated phospholipid phosphatase